jgi:hypothetical protein
MNALGTAGITIVILLGVGTLVWWNWRSEDSQAALQLRPQAPDPRHDPSDGRGDRDSLVVPHADRRTAGLGA